MKFNLRDLSKLQWPVLLTIFLLLTAGTLAYWSERRLQEANAQRASAESQLFQNEQRFRQVHSEEQEIKERTEIFQKLEKSGIAGEENRLEWIELLRDLQRQLHLPGMNYEFGPQQALEKTDGAAFTYHRSHLHIQLRLLHEEDLLNFLERLQQRAQAMLLVRSCRLARPTVSLESGAALTQLSAECDMEWVSLQRATAGKQP